MVEILCVMALKCVVHGCHQFTRAYKAINYSCCVHLVHLCMRPFYMCGNFPNFLCHILFVIYLIWKFICIDFFDTRSVNRLFFRFNPRSANAYKINKHHMEKLNTRDLKHHNTWNHSPLVTFQHLTIAHRQAFKPPRPMFITSFIAIILGIFVVWLTIQCTITCFTTSTINNIVT